MRIVLVQPRAIGKLGFLGISAIEPLALETLAGCVPDHDVRIIDMLTCPDIELAISRLQPDVVGISCSFTTDVYQTIEIARAAKGARRQALVVVGGHHASLNAGDFHLPWVDAIVLGEGENTFREMVDCVAGGGDLHEVTGLVLNDKGRQAGTGNRPLLQNLDMVPLPRRDLTAAYRGKYYMLFERPFATLETARGCPHQCNFCSVWRFYQGRCRYKTPDRVLEDLAAVQETSLLFTDDNFLLNVDRAIRIAQLVERAGIKKRYFFQARSDTIVKHPEVLLAWHDIGLTGVFIGMEKVSEQELAAIHKGNHVENNSKAAEFLERHRIPFSPSFIIDPSYTARDFERLRAFLAKMRIQSPSFSILTPLPGTGLYDEMQEELQTSDYELYDLLHAILPTELNLTDFYKEFASLYGLTLRRSLPAPRDVLAFLRSIPLDRESYRHARSVADSLVALTRPQSYLRGHENGDPRLRFTERLAS